MSYAVKEIFYTLQGEGVHAGRPAVFLRFSGCNLWNGRPEDRSKGAGGCAIWCDTDFFGTNGIGGGHFSSSESLGEAVERAWTTSAVRGRLVVCTGGEPLLQLDARLVHDLRGRGFQVAVETNGTRPSPDVDWLCVSPKAGGALAIQAGDELKFVFPQDGLEPSAFEELQFRHFSIQPKDGPDQAENTRAALRYCLDHPRWRLSLQTHKLLGIP